MHKAFREEGLGTGQGERREGLGTCLYHATENYSSGLGEGKEDSLCKNDSF